MADRGIIFSAAMVQALLDGRKTQTRRVLGRHGPGRGRFNIFSADVGWSDAYVMDPGNAAWRARDTPHAVGDRLWVREAHALVPASAYRMSDGVEQTVQPDDPDCAAVYRAGWDRSPPGRWRSPIHMPRWASRLTLTVTNVRVQRVAEISSADAIAEGCAVHANSATIDCDTPDPRDEFRALWNGIHGENHAPDGMIANPKSWAANPWVCALTFTVRHGNIDHA